MRFDAVFCDVDGCLLPEGGRDRGDPAALAEVAEFNRLAHERADRPVLALCTGRPQPFAEAVARLLGCFALPTICEHGAWLYDLGAHRWELSPDITRADLAAVGALREWIGRELEPHGCYLQLGKTAGTTVFHDDPAWLAREAVPRLEAEIAARSWPLRVSMTWTCINIDLLHVSKAHAIRLVKQRFGLDTARLAGIGDTISDTAIRDEVTFFACPANAADELKPHADYVARAPEARGVAEILKRLTTEITEEHGKA